MLPIPPHESRMPFKDHLNGDAYPTSCLPAIFLPSFPPPVDTEPLFIPPEESVETCLCSAVVLQIRPRALTRVPEDFFSALDAPALFPSCVGFVVLLVFFFFWWVWVSSISAGDDSSHKSVPATDHSLRFLGWPIIRPDPPLSEFHYLPKFSRYFFLRTPDQRHEESGTVHPVGCRCLRCFL